MSQLSIYRASAGSGKTFRLTVEYLKILLKTPLHYKNILAITFTNKATEEMKSRILAQLHQLATGDKNDYFKLLMQETGLDAKTVEENALKAEKYILHDYNRFSVMTIDAFFQMVIKSFAKELNLAHNYDIELDTKTIKEIALDRLFSQLNDDKKLREWLREFAESKIDNGQSWNISIDILQLSEELFSEKLQFLDRELIALWSDKKFMQSYITELNHIIYSYEDKIQKLGQEFLQLIEKKGLSVSDFAYGKSGFAGFLQKTANGVPVLALSSRAEKLLENPDSAYTKKTDTDTINRITEILPQTQELIYNIQNIIEKESIDYNTSLIIKKNIHTIGIFSDLVQHIYTILQDNNKILLSESNKLLHRMIIGNEAPFIYEKIGMRYSHFLWDEFQDTSQMQWNNLRPLLDNALSTGNPCLIVGDIKQAIYRWRNGEWNILQNKVQEDFPFAKEYFLQKNWRSSTRIIDFNNELYKIFPSLLERELGKEDTPIQCLYADSTQEYGSRTDTNNGLVEMLFFENTEDTTALEKSLNKTLLTIIELQQKGVTAEDIVILVRTHKEASILSEYFMQLNKEEYDKEITLNVASEEALLLKSSLSVRILETALAYLHSQERYYEITLRHLTSYLENGNEKFAFWKNYTQEHQCNITNLNTLITQCINIFSLDKISGEQLYLLGFMEELNNFLTGDSENLPTLLSWWDERRNKAVINTGEMNNAIRIYTIHKSKGLEFDHVIIPFGEMPLNKSQNKGNIWCTPQKEPFSKLGKTFIPYGNSLADTVFNDEFLLEKEKRHIDLINVLYVATTRAKTSLHIHFPLIKNGIGALLLQQIENTGDENFWKKHYAQETASWQYGKLEENQKKASPPTNQTIFIEQIKSSSHWINKLSDISQSLPPDSEQEIIGKVSPISQGNLWHNLLQYITTTDDIERVVKRFFYNGQIHSSEYAKYLKTLKETLNNSKIKKYYSTAYRVSNERPILVNRAEYIPDRVVENSEELIIIEYKFGEKESPKYHKQLLHYKNFFSSKTTKKVKALLVYGILNKIVGL